MLTKNIADYTNKRIEECTDLELFNAVLLEPGDPDHSEPGDFSQ